jgi:exopolysaccharide biosynthesis polyprenyl glycosylphosphotransferase
MRSARRPRQLFLLIVDFGTFFLALFLALVVRYQGLPTAERWWGLVNSFLPSWILWVIAFYTADLYNIDFSFDELRFAGRLFAAVAVGGLLSALIFYLGSFSQTPKTILAIYSAILFALLWLWRFAYGRISRLYLPRRVTAFVGVDKTVTEVVTAIETNDHLGYEAAVFLDEAGTAPASFKKRVCRSRAEFVKAVKERSVSLVVVADESSLSEATRRALLDLIERRVHFIRLPEFYEHYLRKVPLGTINDLWFLENIDLPGKARYRIVKRGVDILISLVFLIVCSVPSLLIALAIKLSSRGPVLFRQERLGLGGRVFRILKFRTMKVDGNDFAPTAVKDPRVTAFGRFLRRFALDEIPQAINILFGEMSLVGPRPERPDLAVGLERAIPYYRQRLLVKPGITGWDQVSGEYHSPSVEDTYKKLQYDLYYVKNMSILLDVSIFFKTIMTMLGRKGP